MINKKKKTAMYIAMILITVLVMFPFLWMIILSFKTNAEIMSSPLSLPETLNFDNYMRLRRLISCSFMQIHFLYASPPLHLNW